MFLSPLGSRSTLRGGKVRELADPNSKHDFGSKWRKIYLEWGKRTKTADEMLHGAFKVRTHPTSL